MSGIVWTFKQSFGESFRATKTRTIDELLFSSERIVYAIMMSFV